MTFEKDLHEWEELLEPIGLLNVIPEYISTQHCLDVNTFATLNDTRILQVPISPSITCSNKIFAGEANKYLSFIFA